MTIYNPIFKREFVSTARSWKTNVMVWGYLILLSFVLLTLWPSGGIQSLVSEGARQIFSLFFGVNLALTLLLAPAFSATSITYERENGTYPALFTTQLSAFDIMAGKLSAAILMLLIVSLLSMPIASICALTGGVDMKFMLKAMGLLSASAVSYGLIGLACSSICARSSSAILLNYVLILVLAGATWLPEALLSNLLPDFNLAWQLIRSVSPFDALFYILYPDSYKMTTTMEGFKATPYTVFMIASGLICAASLIVFLLNVLRPASSAAGGSGEVYTDSKKAIKRKLNWPFYLFDPLKRKSPIGRFSNPVFVAEMRSKLFANPQFVMRCVSSIFIVSMLLLTLISFQFGVGLKADTVRMVSIIFQIGVVALLAPGVSSGLITDEITGGTFNQLRMTRLSPITVIAGKLKATFFYALIFIVSSAFVLLAMAYLEQQEIFPDGSAMDPAWWSAVANKVFNESGWWAKFWETYWRIGAWVAILLLSALAFLTGGLFASCISRATSTATALAYGFAATLCIVTMAPLVLEDNLAHWMSALILSFNPIAGAMQVTSDAFSNYPGLWIDNIIAMSLLIAGLLAASVARVWVLFHSQD